MPPEVAVRAVECLSNCSAGCSIALRGSGRWTYVYGNFHEAADIDIIVDGTLRYRKNCIARIPPLEVSDD